MSKDKKDLEKLAELAKSLKEMSSYTSVYNYTLTVPKEIMDNIEKINKIISDELDEYAKHLPKQGKVAYHETNEVLKDASMPKTAKKTKK